MSTIRQGVCGDPGPRGAHCTEHRMHDYSCYDASEDTSWNEGQFRDGSYDDARHECDDPTCEGRPTLRALTVRQPWAWAILAAGKDVENRTRNIVGQYRGTVALHAGLQVDQAAMREAADHADIRLSSLTSTISVGSGSAATGAVIGLVDIVDVHEWTIGCCKSHWAERELHDGRPVNHLILENPRPLARPVRATGHLGLWSLPYSVNHDVRVQQR